MADEELSVRIAVEGVADFNRSINNMERKMESATDTVGDLSTEASKASRGTDSLSDAFDKNTARANKYHLAQVQLTNVMARLSTETDALTRAQLAVRADELKKQIEDLSRVNNDNVQSTKKMGLSLTDLKSGIDMALGAVRAFKEVAVKAFEFAQEGAAIIATKESFDRLGISIEDMREATNNTIPDINLMSSTLTLMAGSSGEVADAFSGAMPQLLAMAKAASKLNPTMGDTTYMLESITTAAKRQSMQIADNLGIIVKQGDAYEKYADSIGVAVSELTNEQKQIAFLNGLLDAGNVLIEQAGGTTESAADSYAQLTTAVENLTNELKTSAAEGWTPFITKLAEGMAESRRQIALQERGIALWGDAYTSALAKAYQGSATAREELFAMNEMIEQLDNSVMTTVKTFDEYIATAGVLSSEIEYQNPLLREQEERARASGEATAAMAESQRTANEAAAAASVSFNNAAAAIGEMTKAAFAKAQIDALKQALDEGRISSDDFAAAQEAILVQFGLLTEAEKRAQGTINTIHQAFIEGKIGPEEYAELLDRVKNGLDAIDGTTIDIGWNVQTPPQILTGGGAVAGAENINAPYQHGGTTSGGRMLVGERGPEMLTGVPGGARVLSAPTTARMMAQNSITNNYNLTTNALTRPGGLALEFAAMEMGSR